MLPKGENAKCCISPNNLASYINHISIFDLVLVVAVKYVDDGCIDAQCNQFPGIAAEHDDAA